MKPSIPKGTRDFSPIEMNRRNYIFDTIKGVFKKYGFQQIETPSMENLETLTGKYGDEGDKLLFKILNSGPVVDQINKSETDIKLNEISEKGLRYDLTVPFARYVVMHQHEITFPFKRYQIQPVWRADRPQKGRYREFYQCDVDVIGSDSLLNEVELIQIIDEVFTKLGMEVTIKINNRKVLYAIAELLGKKDKAVEIATAIDKLDKIGWEGVTKDLLGIGVIESSVEILKGILNPDLPSDARSLEERIQFIKSTSFSEHQQSEEIKYLIKWENNIYKNQILTVENLRDRLMDSNWGLADKIDDEGCNELRSLFYLLSEVNLSGSSSVEFDCSLARGLNYYTGAIIEVKANNVSMGSICGGGRYDDLTGIFGLPNVSGVGISFGADRIYDVLNELNLFPDFKSDSTQLLFVNFGKEEEKFCMSLLAKVRAADINSELYPDQAKLKKQFAYADDKKIPFVAVIGDEEMKTNTITLKDMTSGEQHKGLTIEQVIERMK